jgi:hypothetical protein
MSENDLSLNLLPHNTRRPEVREITIAVCTKMMLGRFSEPFRPIPAVITDSEWT